MMSASQTTLKPESTDADGFIVIAVLWILGALSVLVSIYAVYVINAASAFPGYDDHLKAEALVSAALELTAYRQQGADAQPRPSHGRFDFRLGQANVEVQYHSEAARIDLNRAPKQLLTGLFVVLGATPDNADVYADRVIGWRTAPHKDRDTKALDYRMARLGYRPRGDVFPHVDELSLVRDLPMALVARALPFITVYSGRPQVDVLDAAPEVIAALPGMTRDILNAFLAQRQATPENIKVLLPLLKDARRYATADGGNTFRVKVQITFDDGHTENVEVVILLFDKGDRPYAVLSWHDRTDQTIADNSP
jgi:general secretion pathway protein K